MAMRLRAMGQPHYAQGFALTLHEDALELPLRWRTSRLVFVNSMSDLFHQQIPFWFIKKVFEVMALAHWHHFQVLTKRSERLLALDSMIEWAANVWMGVTVEREDYLSRVDDLRQVRAAVKFLSLEPLLGPLPDVDLSGIDWVVVGGESGPGARAMEREWVIQIRDRCRQFGVPFFFKQWGGVNKKRNGRHLDGRTWDEMPVVVSLPPRVQSPGRGPSRMV
jgi:protein gp37